MLPHGLQPGTHLGAQFGDDQAVLKVIPAGQLGKLDGGAPAVPGEPLSDVISTCYILGFRKDNAKFFNKLSLNHWCF